MKIAIDAMGGDFAPIETVRGAIDASRQYGHKVFLVGDQARIEAEISKYGSKGADIEVVHCDEYVTMDDSPTKILRGKRNSSLHAALRMVKAGEADAFYSAGNTGAVMVVAKMILKTLHGIDRPAIGAVMPNANGFSVVLDVGANVDSKPINFLQYAIMGSAFSHIILDVENPRVSLLSIGEEDIKGNELTKTSFALLKDAEAVNFIGNVEGKELFKGVTDVIVCDGFAGNVLLKVAESTGWYVSKVLKEELMRNIYTKMVALLLAPAFKRIKKRADYTEYGSAPLLGVGGIVCIGHGSSNANAVKHGVRVAGELAENNVNGLIEEKVYETMKSLKVDKEDTFWNNIIEKFRKKSSSN